MTNSSLQFVHLISSNGKPTSGLVPIHSTDAIGWALTYAPGPDFWKAGKEEYQYNPVRKFEAEALKTAGEINRDLQKFSAWRLADGTFWEEPSNGKLADHGKAAS